MSNPTQKKKGFFGRFRKGSKSTKGNHASELKETAGSSPRSAMKAEQRDSGTPRGTPNQVAFDPARDEEFTPVEGGLSQDQPSEVSSVPSREDYTERVAPSQMEDEELQEEREKVKTSPPSAREAAFTGPPRFDWIDVETNAATKLQAAFRRFKVMKMLEDSGLSTSAIRNRRRRRKAAARSGRANRATMSEDAPSIFNWCGMGLVFGDATEEDDDVYRSLQKKRYEEKRKEQAAHEEALRKRFLKSGRDAVHVIEAYEVIEEKEM